MEKKSKAPKETKTAAIYVRLKPSERAAIDEASGGNPTIWAREVLLRAARRKK